MFPQIDILIQEIAAVAAGDTSRRATVVATLQRMTSQGWGLEPVVERIWAGERDASRLTQGLDSQEIQITQDVLDLLEMAAPDEPEPLPGPVLEALTGMPESIRQPLQAALQSGDEAAFQNAYQAAWGQLTNQQDEQFRQALAGWASQASQASQAGQAGLNQAAGQRQALLISLPVDVRLALLDEDPPALQQALNNLSPEQAAGLLEQIVQAGFFSQAEQRQVEQDVQDLEPVIQAIAALANRGEAADRSRADDFLEYLEAVQGAQLRPVIQRLWDGEREAAILTAGLDERDRQVVERILSLIN